MKRFLVRVKVAMSVVALVVTSIVSAFGTLTMTLDDGSGHPVSIVDNGTGDTYPIAGVILWMGPLPGGIWSGNIDVGLSKPLVGGQFDPQMDLSISQAYSTRAGTLTITFTDTGFGPLGNKNGIATLAMGGANNQRSIAAYGQVNGSTVVSLGPLTSSPWSGTAQGNASSLDSSFSLTEKVVIVHTGKGYTMGDISLQVEVVPESTTMIAGAFALLPVGFSCYRCFRKRKQATRIP